MTQTGDIVLVKDSKMFIFVYQRFKLVFETCLFINILTSFYSQPKKHITEEKANSCLNPPKSSVKEHTDVS